MLILLTMMKFNLPQIHIEISRTELFRKYINIS